MRADPPDLSNPLRTFLITGASRGIGAEIALQLSAPERHVVVNYREKARRADAVAAAIKTAGGHVSTACADLCDEGAVERMLDDIGNERGRLDVLILNASGGLERHAVADYAMLLNRDAQVHLVRRALPLMPAGSRIVFVTSHPAHFYGRRRCPSPSTNPSRRASGQARMRCGRCGISSRLPESNSAWSPET